jgi:TPR repeat protein
MSAKNGAAKEEECCASCGIGGVDDIKLKECIDCDSVRYCSDNCQRDHRPQHKQECIKRAAELRDEVLFKQPESSYLGDCPICLLPMPIYPLKNTTMACCSKMMCNGCNHANQLREVEQSLKPTCPFCRHPLTKIGEKMDLMYMKRAEMNDPAALCRMGVRRREVGDYKSAFEYHKKAAELGYFEAHYLLSLLYRDGQGVEKDEKKQVHHLEVAAIGGHSFARLNLGCIEGINGRRERAVKHFIIAAKLGYDLALDALKMCYREGSVSKENYAAALRAQQAAMDAMKSPQREAAEAALRQNRILFVSVFSVRV